MSELNSIIVFGDSDESMTLQKHLPMCGQSFMWKQDDVSVHSLLNLTISNVGLESIEFLTPLVSLRYLCVSFNKICDLSPLCLMRDLRALDASHNKICDINPLAECPKLQVVRLHRNAIESLEALHLAADIIELWVSRNQLQLVEFMHMTMLSKLQHVVIDQNPFEAKPKYIEFLLALCPSILTVNGLPAVSLLPASRTKHWYNPTEFLRTTDGRVMLTQARSQLTESQREFIASHKNPALAASLADTSMSSALLDGTRRKGEAHDWPLGSGDMAVQRHASDSSVLRAASEGGKPIKYFKAKKTQTPKKFIRHCQEERVGTVERDADGINKSHDGSPKGQSTAVEGGSTSEVPMKTVSYPSREEVTVVRFGGDTSPVALSLETDGCGYCRWSKAGPVACTLDTSRLFASYRNGSIAVVLDASGNGSVMTPNGSCVLNLRRANGHGASSGSAEVLNEKGVVLAAYQRRDDSMSADGMEGVSWEFENVCVEFSPWNWELCVRINNGRVESEFSSVSGGRVLRGEGGQGPTAKKRKKTTGTGGVARGETIPNETHESMRSGLQSVMSTLDDMLAGLNASK